MDGTSTKETLIQEIEALPESRLADVLAFIRFVKIGLADEGTVEGRFTEAMPRAREIALQRGITEQDIDEEIRAVS